MASSLVLDIFRLPFARQWVPNRRGVSAEDDAQARRSGTAAQTHKTLSRVFKLDTTAMLPWLPPYGARKDGLGVACTGSERAQPSRLMPP